MWILIDNGFCVIYYAIFAIIAAFQKIHRLNQDVLLGPLIVFNLILVMNHLFMFIVFKYIYDDLKAAESHMENVDMHSLDYGEVIQKERKKLNQDYEVPVSLHDELKSRSSHATPRPDFLRELSHRIEGMRGDKKAKTNLNELKNEKVIYADIQSAMKLEPRNSEEIYEKPSESNDK